ncbi:MAG: response regulator, partial [Planctomycetaceae bacterium]|nr:response regulator [Planctomycetaceae bacterium]
MGGRIWCESNPGPGTTFHAVVNLEVRPRQPGLETTTAAHLRNRSVLVIDGHRTTREILAELISAWGMSPHLINEVPTDPLELLDHAKQAGCEVVILDAGLVDPSGKLLVDGLQHLGGLQRTVLLIPPGELGSGVVRNWQMAGAAAFVEKPVSQSDLLEAIIRTLGEHSTVGTSTWIAPISAAPRALDLLVAEDIPANQKVVRSILELRGHTVEIASNGAEAVDRAKQHRFDGILMDIRMPLLSGIEATRQIRKLPDPRLNDVPIIALTAHVLTGDRKRCLQVGMNAFVTKPIDAEELIRSVEIVTASVEHSRRLQQAEPPFAFGGKSRIQTMSTEPPVLDIAQALARLGGDREILSEMADFFRVDVPQLYQTLQNSLMDDDLEEATRAAHSIKGLAANFDALMLRDTTAKIEEACRAGQPTIARELLDRCNREIGKAIRALARELPSGV